MKKKWKTVVFISIVCVVLIAVVLCFYLIILNTPNININIKFVSNGALGTVDSRIANGANGSPNTLFSFDYTEEGSTEYVWKNKNILFKDDKETITVILNVSNMSNFKTNCKIEFDSPHKNAKVTTLLNDVECDISNLILDPYTNNNIVNIVIGKLDYKKPIRANLNLTLTLTPQ